MLTVDLLETDHNKQKTRSVETLNAIDPKMSITTDIVLDVQRKKNQRLICTQLYKLLQGISINKLSVAQKIKVLSLCANL